MVIKFSIALTDQFMFPYMSQFTNAEIPDMSGHCSQSDHWVSNFILNTFFRQTLQAPLRQYFFNFLRRSETAFREHALAHEATVQFLEGSRQSPSRYMMALFHWEIFLTQAWHALALLSNIQEVKVFEKGNGSVEERLNLLYNQSKHTESVIKSGEMLETATVSVWLTNDGLKSHNGWLTY
jgi:hypothetical protein